MRLLVITLRTGMMLIFKELLCTMHCSAYYRQNERFQNQSKCQHGGVELALPRLGIAGKTIVKQNDAPEYIIGNDRDLARYNKQIYREVSDIKTTGGEVILRILSPIEKRD